MSNRPENSITIEGIDDATLEKLQAQAAQRGVTVGVIAREALERGAEKSASSAISPDSSKRREAIAKLAGAWSAEDAAEFAEAIKPFEQIDPEIWS
jgi:hypothetical protein